MVLGYASSWFDARVIDGTVNGAGWITRLTGSISVWWDKWIIDGLLVNGPAILSRIMSYPTRMLEWGLMQWYALVMIVGLVGFLCMELGWTLWFWVGVGALVAVAVMVALLRALVFGESGSGEGPGEKPEARATAAATD